MYVIHAHIPHYILFMCMDVNIFGKSLPKHCAFAICEPNVSRRVWPNGQTALPRRPKLRWTEAKSGSVANSEDWYACWPLAQWFKVWIIILLWAPEHWAVQRRRLRRRPAGTTAAWETCRRAYTHTHNQYCIYCTCAYISICRQWRYHIKSAMCEECMYWDTIWDQVRIIEASAQPNDDRTELESQQIRIQIRTNMNMHYTFLNM